MTKDEIIRMAREVGALEMPRYDTWQMDNEILERFAALVAAHEREKQAEQEPVAWQFFEDGKWWIGSEYNHHRQLTEEAGYPVRELYAAPVQQAEQEPVAKYQGTDSEYNYHIIKLYEDLPEGALLYAAPQPVKQEPVGYFSYDEHHDIWEELISTDAPGATPLYAAPVQQVDLTDDQKQLARFYQVETLSELVTAMELHIEKLQAKIEHRPVYLRTPREG